MSDFDPEAVVLPADASLRTWELPADLTDEEQAYLTADFTAEELKEAKRQQDHTELADGQPSYGRIFTGLSPAQVAYWNRCEAVIIDRALAETQQTAGWIAVHGNGSPSND